MTHLTAGARLARGTIPKPAARTAADCSNPAEIRVPTGMDEMELISAAAGGPTHDVPKSSIIKLTQSVNLQMSDPVVSRAT